MVASRKWSFANPPVVASRAHLSVLILDHLSRHQTDWNLKRQRQLQLSQWIGSTCDRFGLDPTHFNVGVDVSWTQNPLQYKCASPKVVILPQMGFNNTIVPLSFSRDWVTQGKMKFCSIIIQNNSSLWPIMWRFSVRSELQHVSGDHSCTSL